MFILLPVEAVRLPLNMTLVDLWTMAALPIVWLSVPRGKHPISLTYVVPLWLIFLGSFVSIFVAPAPRNGLIVVLKELFACLWFITLTFVLTRISEKELRRLLLVWSTAVLAHGLLILAQFIFPDFWRSTAHLLERSSEYEVYRASGLMTNANAAGLFQVLGVVPLLLLRPSRRTGILLGAFLVLTIAATGSMGSLLSLTAGAVVALTALAFRGEIAALGRTAIAVALMATFFGAVYFFGSTIAPRQQQEADSPGYTERLEKILLGRADRSSESRFDLWERGFSIFSNRGVYVWGIGPENFRVVDGEDKQLHNDFMAFLVERGLVSTLGLGLFAFLALFRAFTLYLHAGPQRLVLVVFMVAMVAAFIFSLTHQIFHNRQLWMILALQEAMIFRLNALSVPASVALGRTFDSATGAPLGLERAGVP